jgi:hypothetical protein
MASRYTILILITFLMIVGMSTFVGVTIAAPPPPPGPPALSGGGGSSSGGGSSGGSSYSAPTFTPFVDPILSSNGMVIGNLTGKSTSSTLLCASSNLTVGSKNYTLTMESELTQKPTSDTRLDINLMSPNASGLPEGMNSITLLGMVNIVRHSTYGWNVKGETIKLTFNVPGTPGSDPNTIYYLVKYDGSSYNIQNATLKSSGVGMMTLEAYPGTDTGMFTLIMVGSVVPTPTPMPSLTPTPAGATPIPASSDGTLNLSGTALYMVMAILGLMVLVITALIYMLYIKR